MKSSRLIAFFLVVFGVIWLTRINPQVSGATKAEQIISAFVTDNQLGVEKNTPEYLEFMKGILLGDYPELTGENSEYIHGQKELDLILEYATGEMSTLFKDYPVEPGIQEAIPEVNQLDNAVSSESLLAYSRTSAINYAYSWWNGQNSSYPDFGSSDCTNFISQTMRAGGFSIYGSGDGCRDESTQTEWYVESNSPPPWCLGSNRNWEWSTAWSVVYDFRRYFTYHHSYATELGWTTSYATAKDLLSPGDIVQLQQLQNGNWVSYHNMLVTAENATDLLLTYHSTDTRDKRLRDIPAGATQRYVLVRFP
ncbi:MAG: amidase domain-containing protein [Anaerolineales bacterium]|nr:amidase domain-containing protein [Anaerolineales bacterium]